MQNLHIFTVFLALRLLEMKEFRLMLDLIAISYRKYFLLTFVN